MMRRLSDTALELATLASAFLTMLCVQALAERLVRQRRYIAQLEEVVEAPTLQAPEGGVGPTPNGTEPEPETAPKPAVRSPRRKAGEDGGA